MASSYDRLVQISAAPWGPNSLSNGLVLRVFQQFTSGYDDSMDGSHLPMVQPVRDLQRRVENLDAATTKFRAKSTECTTTLQLDLPHCDDNETKILTESLMRSHKMLADYLEGLHPILREHKETVKRLSEYLTPPTVELFQKKATHLLKDALPQEVSMAKKNTCTICMDASADCVIKRTCNDNPSSSHQVKCERDVCKCGPTMCKDCLLTHYWTSTGKGSKSYARCVCCRAEFCLKDVFPVQYVEDEAYLQHKSEQEKKAKEREVMKAASEEGGGGRTRRGRKSNLVANMNTTTTTTTTSSHNHTHPPFPLHTFTFSPLTDTFTTTTTTSNNHNDYHHNPEEFPSTTNEELGNRKRRRTNNTTTTTTTTTHRNNNDNNDNSDGDRSKYHLRSSRRSNTQ